MSLFTATLIPGIFLIAIGGLLLWNNATVGQVAKQSLRNHMVTLVLMGLSSAWFLFEIIKLGKSDFGDHKNILFLIFLAIAVVSFYKVPDFLGVRGGAILTLLISKLMLDAAFLEEPSSRLFMVSFVYLCITLALYLGAVPFKLRDFLNWLFDNNKRPKIFGFLFSSYGVLLLGVAFKY